MRSAEAADDGAIYRAILDSLVARIAWIGPDRIHRYANAEYAAFFGRAVADVIGRSVAEVVGEEVAASTASDVARALAGEALRSAGWVDYPQERRIFVERIYTPVGKGARGYYIIMRDLTAVRRREEELATRSAQLEAILANIAEGVNIIDREGRVVLSNAGFHAMYDFPPHLGTPGTALGDYVRHRLVTGQHYAYEDREAELELLIADRVARLMSVGDETLEETRPDGRIIEVRRRRLPDGALLSTYTDVTARRLAERALRAQRDSLRQAERVAARSSLLAGVAHEINNPLAIVVAQAALLAQSTRGPNRDRARKIGAAAARAARIVTSFLAMARRRVPKREEVRFNEALSSALDLIGYRLVDAAVALETDVPEDLPPVSGDADQIVHLLVNLLANAQRALRERPTGREVRVAAAASDGSLDFIVADNGPGIPPALRERVFAPFFTTRAEGDGTGIGLTLCRTIVSDHGGTIMVEDTPGGGATLRVSLPLAREPYASRRA